MENIYNLLSVEAPSVLIVMILVRPVRLKVKLDVYSVLIIEKELIPMLRLQDALVSKNIGVITLMILLAMRKFKAQVLDVLLQQIGVILHVYGPTRDYNHLLLLNARKIYVASIASILMQMEILEFVMKIIVRKYYLLLLLRWNLLLILKLIPLIFSSQKM